MCDRKGEAAYSGSAQLIVNNNVVTTQNFGEHGTNMYPENQYFIGDVNFDTSGYTGTIQVRISTNQCVGSSCNVVPNSYTVNLN